MKKLNLIVGFFAVLFLVDILLYLYQPLGENFYIIGDLGVILLSLLAFVFGIYAYKFYGFRSLQGKALLFLSFGVFFWFLGETTWGIYEIALGIETPSPSIADAFWLIGYPFFLLGLYYILEISQFPTKKTKLIPLIFLTVLICFILIYLSLPNLLDPEISLFQKLSTSGYVIGDMLLLVVIIFGIANLFAAKILKAYSLIIVGIIFMSIADIYYMNFSETYTVGNLIDLFWNLSYILLALGFFYHREIMKNLLKK